MNRVDFEVRKRTKSKETHLRIESAVRVYIEKTGYTEVHKINSKIDITITIKGNQRDDQ